MFRFSFFFKVFLFLILFKIFSKLSPVITRTTTLCSCPLFSFKTLPAWQGPTYFGPQFVCVCVSVSCLFVCLSLSLCVGCVICGVIMLSLVMLKISCLLLKLTRAAFFKFKNYIRYIHIYRMPHMYVCTCVCMGVECVWVCYVMLLCVFIHSAIFIIVICKYLFNVYTFHFMCVYVSIV